jgi:hypothetical protein
MSVHHQLVQIELLLDLDHTHLCHNCANIFCPCDCSPTLCYLSANFTKRGVNRCPNLLTDLDKSCFCRPGSVRPASVPSAFQQVISPGGVFKTMQIGTSPSRTNRSPTTLSCLLICRRAWAGSAGLPSPAFFHPTFSRIERVQPLFSALGAAANETRERSCDAY